MTHHFLHKAAILEADGIQVPENANPDLIGALVLLTNSKEEILCTLTNVDKTRKRKGQIEIPWGAVNNQDGETPIQAVRREVQEEIGLILRQTDDEINFIGSLSQFDSQFFATVFYYHLQCEFQYYLLNHDPVEVQKILFCTENEIKWMPPEKIRPWILQALEMKNKPHLYDGSVMIIEDGIFSRVIS